MKLITVLKSGGEFNEGHVQRLKKQCPDIEMECITDSTMPEDHFYAVTGAKKIPLLFGAWGARGWWAKMEMFRPDIKGNFLYADLDTTFLKQPLHFLNLEISCVLSDFYFPNTSIGSGLMFLTEETRRMIWDKWIKAPIYWIEKNHGDQDFLTPWLWPADRFQEKFPYDVVSYKAHLNKNFGRQFFKPGFDDLSKITAVCFHGHPRPWEVSEINVLDKKETSGFVPSRR